MLTEDARRACLRLAQVGRWHAAAEATIPCPQLPQNEETRERLEALHPRRIEAFPADVMNARIDEPYQTSEASVLKCIQSWGSRISPGPSLLTRDHMKQLVNDASSVCLAPLTTFVNLMLAGTMDAEAADWISAGCLSALGKPGHRRAEA